MPGADCAGKTCFLGVVPLPLDSIFGPAMDLILYEPLALLVDTVIVPVLETIFA